MKHISILALETAIPAAIVDPRYMFTAVNSFYTASGGSPQFEVQLVGAKKDITLSDGTLTIHNDATLDDVRKTDLIIIPAISGDIKKAIELNEEFLPWIIDQHNKGAEVASLCIGSFILASTGLMSGKSCSTHWLYAHEFRAMFPDVNMVDDRVITDQQGLYSSGGANAYWSLLLYLVEKYTNRETAIMASKFFLLDIGRKSQSPFIMFKGQKDHEDYDIIKAQEEIEKNYQEKISVDQLCDQIGMGRRTFERRFKKATSNTVVEYIQRVKVEAAKKELEVSRKNVNEVMYDVGYTDAKAFREVFRKITGLSPIEYRGKYQAIVPVN